jgi:RNA polymerase sigma-70 factor (ECF subfamily)
VPDTSRLSLDRNDNFDAFYIANFSRICGAMTLLTKDQYAAQEVTQDAFLKAYERWNRVSSGDNPEAWVYKTAYNLTRRRWTRLIRRERFSDTGSASEFLPSSSMPDDSAIDLQRAIAQLPEMQRAVVVARYMLGYSTEETANALDLSASNVRVLSHRACKTLGLSRNLADPSQGDEP